VYLEPLVPATASEQLEVSAPTQENIPRRVQHLQVSQRFKGTVSGEKYEHLLNCNGIFADTVTVFKNVNWLAVLKLEKEIYLLP